MRRNTPSATRCGHLSSRPKLGTAAVSCGQCVADLSLSTALPSTLPPPRGRTASAMSKAAIPLAGGRVTPSQQPSGVAASLAVMIRPLLRGILPPSVTGSDLAMAMILVLLTLVLVALLGATAFIATGGGKKRDVVLVVGPPGAGKTALFNLLVHGKAGKTVMSLEPNVRRDWRVSGAYGKTREVTLVAWPGHPKLRAGLAELLWSATCLVLLIDGSDFNPNVRAIGELFLDTAGSRAMSGARVPVLLCTNKSDLGAKCHSQGYIKKKLEQEIQKLLESRESMADTAGTRTHRSALGRQEPGKFSLDACPAKVTQGSASVLEGEIATVMSFIQQAVGLPVAA